MSQAIEGAPDLVIEVLSESTAYRDLVKKLYARFGVKEYWIVDPGERTVEVYLRHDNDFALARSGGEGETVASQVLAGLAIDLWREAKQRVIHQRVSRAHTLILATVSPRASNSGSLVRSVALSRIASAAAKQSA